MTEDVKTPTDEPKTPPVDDKQTPPQDPPVDPPKEPVVPDKLDLTAEPTEDAVEVVATGDKVIDQIGALLADKKVPDANNIIKEVQETGELSIAAQAALVETLGEAMASLVVSQLDTHVQAQKETATKENSRLMEYAAKRFGEEDIEGTWAGIQAFAKSPESGIPEADLKAMNAMLQAGGLQAEMVIDRIAKAYENSADFTQEADLLQGDSPSTSGFAPLSKQDYVTAKREAVQKYGDGSRQVTELENRRSLSIKRGY